MLCDWNLPGKPGIALVHTIREQPQHVPILMVSGRTDRASIITAGKEGVDGFIGKPFDVEEVIQRLMELLVDAAELPADDAEDADGIGTEVATAGESPDRAARLMSFLHDLEDSQLELPVMQAARDAGISATSDEVPDLQELAERWRNDPALTMRLLAMANSSIYSPSGQICSDLHGALQRLGSRTSINVATALALRRDGRMNDPRLTIVLDQQMEFADKVAAEATELARGCGIDPALCQTAALLHRLGELCVLFLIDQWQCRHGEVEDSAVIDQALQQFAAPFAYRSKTLWRYPARLCQLIGAIYELPPGTVKREKYLLRLAGGSVHGSLEQSDIDKLQRLIKQ